MGYHVIGNELVEVSWVDKGTTVVLEDSTDTLSVTAIGAYDSNGITFQTSSGTAAITIDDSGHVTKIGQDAAISADVLTYDGSKWVASAPTTGDIEGVTAGTGLSGGGTSGTVTLNVDASQTQVTGVGTITTGTWQGTAIDSAYLDADTAHLSGTQTFSGAKTFSGGLTSTIVTINNGVGNDAAIVLGDGVANYWQVMYDAANADANHRFIIYDADAPVTESPFVIEQGAAADSMYLDSTGCGIGTGAPATKLHVIGAATVESSDSTESKVTIKNTNADANPAILNLTKDSASPADADQLGEIVFNGDGSGGAETMFGKIVGVSTDVTAGTEDGQILFKIRSNGGVKQICSVDASALTIGEGEQEDTMIVFDGNVQDFRIGLDDGTDKLEIGAGSAHGTTAALIVDGSGEVTKIGQDTPTDAQVLTWDNTNSKVVWSDAAGGGDTTALHVQTDSTSTAASAASVDVDAGVVMCVTASGARYVQLPTVATDRRLFIKDKSGNAATNNVTIKTNGTEEIDGSSSDLVLSTDWASVQIVSDGTKWYII